MTQQEIETYFSIQQIVTESAQIACNEFLEPTLYAATPEGLQAFLDANAGALPYLTAEEIVTPHHKGKAEALGFNVFVPPQEVWVCVATLALIHHKLRSLAGSPVYVRNAWRPKNYNAAVGGAEESDHITGRAFDLDFTSEEARRRAEPWIRARYEEREDLSLGLGGKTILLFSHRTPSRESTPTVTFCGGPRRKVSTDAPPRTPRRTANEEKQESPQVLES